MAGIRWRAETQLRYLSVETGLDYYWTSVYYYENLGSTPYVGDFYNTIIEATANGTLDTVRRVAIRLTDVTHGTEYGIVTLGADGLIDADGDEGSLTNVARLVGWNEGRQVSYKLWRVPLRIGDISGKDISGTMQGIINDGVLDALNSLEFCNVHGVPIQEWTCDGAVHIWQLRHGTKRRERVVFAYP